MKTTKLNKAYFKFGYWSGRCDEAKRKTKTHYNSDRVIKARQALFESVKNIKKTGSVKSG